MKLTPRDYQQDAHDAAIAWIKKCVDPCLIEAPTGSGKSIIVAMLANTIHKMSGKKILCLAPSKELVQQNHAKYLLTGEPASLFSASAGRKETKNFVVFGSPQTVVNSLERFGKQYAAVVIDEAHGLTGSVLSIIAHMQQQNPLLRVIGLSATPFRMGTGYIYRNHYEHGGMDEDVAIDPFFQQLVYSIDARMLIARGYLSQPVFGVTADHYDTAGMVLNRMGQFKADDVDRAFVGKGRKTSMIVADFVAKAHDKKGVMVFAATRQHATEIMESLPAELSAMIDGETKKKDRELIIGEFKAKRIKYLASVGALTTGFDAPHVDMIAILRRTESVGLFQQIVGRGLRIDDGKRECVILDYAENMENHCPHGDLFAPEIKARRALKGEPMQICCPSCGHENQFSARPNPDEFEMDKDGYFIDLAGNRVLGDMDKPIPAHFGRRCQGFGIVAGHAVQCNYKWSTKECEECGAENDITARYCSSCRGEIVDPNTKLRLDAIKLERDPYRVRFSNVLSMQMRLHPGRDGKPDTIRVDYQIEEKPHTVSEWLSPDADNAWLVNKWVKFAMAAFGYVPESISQAIELRHSAKCPARIAYKKEKSSKYYTVIGVEHEVSAVA